MWELWRRRVFRDSLIGRLIKCRQADTDMLWAVIVDHVVLQAIRKSWRWFSEMAGLGLRELGATGLRVTSIGYGGSPLGNLYGTVKEEEAIASVHEAARLGVNYFDVSPYVHPLPHISQVFCYNLLHSATLEDLILSCLPIETWCICTTLVPLSHAKKCYRKEIETNNADQYVVTEVKNSLAAHGSSAFLRLIDCTPSANENVLLPLPQFLKDLLNFATLGKLMLSWVPYLNLMDLHY